MSKPEWQKNVELLEAKKKEIEALKNKISTRKPLIFKRRRELRIAALDGEIAEIDKMVTNLKTKKRGEKITRSGIQGIVLERSKVNEARKKAKKKRSEKQESVFKAAKNAATRPSEKKYWEKREQKAKKKVDKLKNKIVRIKGVQRTIEWPKYRKLHLRELSDSRAAAKIQVRKDRYNDMMTRSSTYASLGTVSGSVKAAAYMVKGAFYKKRVGVTEKVTEALRHTVVKVFGARKKKSPKGKKGRTP